IAPRSAAERSARARSRRPARALRTFAAGSSPTTSGRSEGSWRSLVAADRAVRRFAVLVSLSVPMPRLGSRIDFQSAGSPAVHASPARGGQTLFAARELAASHPDTAKTLNANRRTHERFPPGARPECVGGEKTSRSLEAKLLRFRRKKSYE